MISIIICTLQEILPQELVSNIQNTIGVEYEIISIYNKNNRYSIFEAYNIGVSKAQYSICCFMHDDIEYRSNNWGVFVVNYFKSCDKLGAVAVAGCKYIRKMPSIWSIPDYNVVNIIQSDRKSNTKTDFWLNNITEENIVVFDGLWFCIRKSLFNLKLIKFDTENYQGFHFYDLDISLQIILANYRIISCPDILIEHTSRGNVETQWLKSSIVFFNKWKNSLPISLVETNKSYSKELENRAIISFLRLIKYLHVYELIKTWFNISVEVKDGKWNLIKVLYNYLIYKKY